MKERTYIDIQSLEAIIMLLEEISIKLQDKQMWDLLTQCEQAKAGI